MLPKKLFIVPTLTLFLLLSASQTAHAASLYLSPASGTIGQGNTKVIQIRLNTGGDQINGVAAYLSYPADKLSASVGGGGPFSVVAESGAGGGGIRISKGSFNAVTGDVLVGTITLRGIAQGPASVSFSGGSAAARAADSSNALTGSSGGNYTVGANVPQPTAVPGSKTTTTTTSTDNKAPVVSDLQITNISTNSAVITWKTDEKADSTVEYGLESTKYFLAENTTTLVTDHKITLQSQLLVPGVLLYIKATSKDVSGNSGSSPEKTLQIKGYQLTIRLVDTFNRPIANTEVYLYSDPKKAITDAQGKAIFTDVVPGKHVVVAKLPSGDTAKEISVAENAQPQQVVIKAAASSGSGSSSPIMTILFILMLILGIATIIVTVIYLKKRPAA